jgi:hypothetical protein
VRNMSLSHTTEPMERWGKPKMKDATRKQSGPVKWLQDESENSAALRYLERVGKGSLLYADRSPSLLHSYITQGDETLPMIAEQGGAICAYAALSIRWCILRGGLAPTRIGYLGGLHKDVPSPGILRDGYRLIGKLPVERQPKLLLTAIMNSSTYALKTIGSGRQLFGSLYQPIGGYATHLFKPLQALSQLRRFGRCRPSLRARFDLSEYSESARVALSTIAAKWNGHRVYSQSTDWRAQGIDLHRVEVCEFDEVCGGGTLLNADRVRRWRVQFVHLSPIDRCALALSGWFGRKPSLTKLRPTIFLDSLLFHPEDFEVQQLLLIELCREAVRLYGDDITLCFGVLEDNPIMRLLAPIPKHTVRSTLFVVEVPGLETISVDDHSWYIDAASL